MNEWAWWARRGVTADQTEADWYRRMWARELRDEARASRTHLDGLDWAAALENVADNIEARGPTFNYHDWPRPPRYRSSRDVLGERRERLFERLQQLRCARLRLIAIPGVGIEQLALQTIADVLENVGAQSDVSMLPMNAELHLGRRT